MTDKQLRKLRRSELLEMRMEIEQENETLAAENRDLRARLEDKQLRIEKSGSLAEAALQLSGVFEAAQRAAELYLENIKQRSPEDSAGTERQEV